VAQVEMQRALLEAALPHVMFDGWTEATIRAAARDLDLDPEAAMNLFPAGPRDLVEAFSLWADAQMLAGLASLDLEEMRVRDRIASGIRLRLECLEPHREAVRKSLSFLGLPPNAPLATRLLWRTADELWYACGDRATDYNYYSKRLLLSGVISATTLYWLDDRSEGASDTNAFLERRIDEVLTVGMRVGKTMSSILDLPDRLFRRPSLLDKRPRRRMGLR
jgi:ubiquinone biosynthesis protein COQ9